MQCKDRIGVLQEKVRNQGLSGARQGGSRSRALF